MGGVNAKEISFNPESNRVHLEKVKAKVVTVNVEGLKKTKDDIVMETVQDMFEASHFLDVILKAQNVRGNLQYLGCFKDVAVHIDASETGGSNYKVTFKVKEQNNICGKLTSLVGNNEGTLLASVKFPNLFGRGEELEYEYRYGTKKSNSFNATLSKPLRGKYKNDIALTAYQSSGDYSWSGFKQLNKGILANLTLQSFPQVFHNLQWGCVWREISCLNKSTAFAVREYAGHTLKSYISHILTVDRRDNAIFPKSGTFFKLTQEFAGLGGDIGFFKNDIVMQASCPVVDPDVIVQGSFNAGLLKYIGGGNRGSLSSGAIDKTISICDNFFLGGPLNVRGFDINGIGPQSDGNFLGGQLYWAGGLHVYAPLPFRPGKGGFGDMFNIHSFINAGNLLDQNNLMTDDKLAVLMTNFRLSYGIGLTMTFANTARLELNYCLPLRSCSGDKVNPGIQFGIGINFL